MFSKHGSYKWIIMHEKCGRPDSNEFQHTDYRTRAIITRSWSETALIYKPRILGLKNEEFSFLVHKWSVI